MPLTGGTVSGAMTVVGGITTQKMTTDTLSVTDASGKISVTGSKLNFGQNNGTITSTITGISDSTGTSSTIAASQKCLSDNYIAKTSAAVSAAINLLPAGTSAPVDADYYVCQSVGGGTTDTTYYRRPMSYLWSYINGKLGNSYLPLSGGTITGDTTIMGSGGQYGLRIINGDIHFLSDGGSSVLGVLGGIVSSKGTSAAHAMSQKGVADNYIAKTDISNAKGTDTTKVPSLKCLSDNYLPLSGGTLTGELNADKGLQATGAKIYGGASIIGATDIYDLTVHDFRTRSDDEMEGISIDQTSIQYYNTNDSTGWTFAGTVFSTTDLTAGTSALPDNQLYFVYE